MSIKRLQNTIAESRYALLVAAIIAAAIWYFGGLVEKRLYIQMGLVACSTLLMVELNNGHALIRIYSRMVSCVFLALTCASCFLYPLSRTWIVTLCFISFFLIIFHAYQDKQAPGWHFYAFLCLGIASTVFVQTFFYVPLLWILTATLLNAASFRSFWASILGLMLPYWFLLPISAFNNQLHSWQAHFMSITQFQPIFMYEELDEHRMITFAIIVFLTLIGMIHFWRNSYMDKIRTRMFYEMLIINTLATIAFVVLQPQHFDTLMGIIIIGASVTIAHFIALTHTRLTNIVFISILILIILLTIYNQWMPSLLF